MWAIFILDYVQHSLAWDLSDIIIHMIPEGMQHPLTSHAYIRKTIAAVL